MSYYQKKYFKYKHKYESLKNIIGGGGGVQIKHPKYGTLSSKINYHALYNVTKKPIYKEIAEAIDRNEIIFETTEIKFPNKDCDKKWMALKTYTTCNTCGQISRQKFFVHYQDSDSSDFADTDKCFLCGAKGHYNYLCGNKNCPDFSKNK
jgi:hypothetical protein